MLIKRPDAVIVSDQIARAAVTGLDLDLEKGKRLVGFLYHYIKIGFNCRNEKSTPNSFDYRRRSRSSPRDDRRRNSYRDHYDLRRNQRHSDDQHLWTRINSGNGPYAPAYSYPPYIPTPDYGFQPHVIPTPGYGFPPPVTPGGYACPPSMPAPGYQPPAIPTPGYQDEKMDVLLRSAELQSRDRFLAAQTAAHNEHLKTSAEIRTALLQKRYFS